MTVSPGGGVSVNLATGNQTPTTNHRSPVSADYSKDNMLISELIKRLENIRSEHGDMDVRLEAETVVITGDKQETWRVGGNVDLLEVSQYMDKTMDLRLSPREGLVTGVPD